MNSCYKCVTPYCGMVLRQHLRNSMKLPKTTYCSYEAQKAVKTKQKETCPADFDFENAKPFEELPRIGKFELLRSFLPGGALYKKPITDLMWHFNGKYGDIFRFPGLFTRPEVIITFNPADYPVIVRNEGKWPIRRSFESVTYHRQVHRKDFFQGVEGLISSSGEKWAKIRSAINPILVQPRSALLYFNTLDEISEEFLKRVREIRDPATNEMPDTFEDEIKRLTFESVVAVALNTQLGVIRKNHDSAETKTILQTLRDFMNLAYDLEIGPSIWKYVKTRKFYRMMRTCDTMTDICSKYINEALRRIEHDTRGYILSRLGREKSVLEKLVHVDRKVAIVMALDMMMVGVDTTTTSLVGILLCIATNPEKQLKLLEELECVMPDKHSPLSVENMRNMPYLRACIKEGIRMYPIGPGTMRRMPYDVILSGYRVPQGSEVAMAANLQMCNEKFVPHAKQFEPERWLRDGGGSTKLFDEIANPFMYMPFGFGTRMCAGKRIAELELELNVARLVRNFHIEFNYPIENAFKSKFFNVPNIPLKFRFEERTQ